jgi:hypothetical protein
VPPPSRYCSSERAYEYANRTGDCLCGHVLNCAEQDTAKQERERGNDCSERVAYGLDCYLLAVQKRQRLPSSAMRAG